MSKADPGPVFAALGDPTRRALLLTLSDGRARSITTLSIGTGLTRQAIAKHLRVLTGAGLVGETRRGRETRFDYRAAPLDDAQSYLDAVRDQWGAALGRLRTHIESGEG